MTQKSKKSRKVDLRHVTPEEREDIRYRVSDMLGEGRTIAEIHEETGVSAQMIYLISREIGIRPASDAQIAGRSSWRILAELLYTDKTFDAIGKEFRVSRQRVHQIACKARDAGIDVGRIKKKREARKKAQKK